MENKTQEQLETEAKKAHDYGDYYTWGKIQAELDRVYLVNNVRRIPGCNCFTCRQR